MNATHQANVYQRTNVTVLDTDSALNYYLSSGLQAANISLGLPLFGKSFENTTGLAQPFDGVGPGGPVLAGDVQQNGSWYYSSLPRAGATVFYDDIAKASYSYDPAALELISYDDPQSATFKAQYAVARGLKGTFFFEARGDRPAGSNDSLVGTTAVALGVPTNDTNNLFYPTSQYNNIRNPAML